MNKLIQFFGSWLQFHYSCFDRIVINGYLPQLYRIESLVYFLRKICGVEIITKEILRGRSHDYQKWVEGYALNHGIPCVWGQKGQRKEEIVRPHLKRFFKSNTSGVYYIFKSFEQGTTFRILRPKSTEKHSHLVKQRSIYTHFYFYLVDEVLGPMVLRVGSFLPFAATAYLNQHNFIERQLCKQGIAFRKSDNAFLWVQDLSALQKAVDDFSADLIAQRLDYWIFRLGPTFSKKERQAAGWALRRLWAINQIEYCRNFVFRNNLPIRSLFERSCELSLYRLMASRIANIFGYRITRRFAGRVHNLFERMDHGQHVLRSYLKTSFLKMYEKLRTFLRLEVVCNNPEDFGMRKSLKYLPEIKNRLQEITERFADFQAESLNVYPEFDLFGQLAKAITVGKTRIAGIKLEQARMIRLFEVLLQSGGFKPFTTQQIHQTLANRFSLRPQDYSLNQLRYDMRKLRAHGLLARNPKRRTYSLTEKGKKAALLFVLFRKKVYGPIAGSLFFPLGNPRQNCSKFESAVSRVDSSINSLLKLLAA